MYVQLYTVHCVGFVSVITNFIRLFYYTILVCLWFFCYNFNLLILSVHCIITGFLVFLFLQLKVRPRDLQICHETSSGVDTSGHYQLGDMVMLEWVQHWKYTLLHVSTGKSLPKIILSFSLTPCPLLLYVSLVNRRWVLSLGWRRRRLKCWLSMAKRSVSSSTLSNTGRQKAWLWIVSRYIVKALATKQ